LKKYFYLLVCTLLLCYSCSDDDTTTEDYKTYAVSIQLAYPQDSGLDPIAGVAVKLSNSSNATYDATTDASGKASFVVPAGVYSVSASDKRSSEGYSFIYNGTKGNIVVTDTWTGTEAVELSLTGSKAGQVIIKELYVGGCQKDDGSGAFHMDKYAILYNNSELPVNLDNFCLGMVLPYNANATNNDYVDGKLFYEAEGWIPAGTGIWYYSGNLTIEPWGQVVIAMNGAIDHTQTYSNSINFSNSEYYCTYDIVTYSNTSYYPSPSSSIPTSHYFSAVHYGAGNAWPLSTTSPAFYIFRTDGVSPQDFANNADNTNYHGDVVKPANIRKKVPTEWILDGVEVYTTNNNNNVKRLTAAIDGGQIYLTNTYGYSLYRNVDEEATKALEGNEAKLIYNYNKGTTVNNSQSTDPSGIDAEASIKNGAIIVYQDTNNSSNDFHQRSQASLKD